MIEPPQSRHYCLLDANIVIEAVRCGCWNAISGQLCLCTVEKVKEELEVVPNRRRFQPVTAEDIARFKRFAQVSDEERGELALQEGLPGLDEGERDLTAHALTVQAEDWSYCTADIAPIKAMVFMGFGDRLVSLERLAASVGNRPRPPLYPQFTEEFLGKHRQDAVMEMGRRS